MNAVPEDNTKSIPPSEIVVSASPDVDVVVYVDALGTPHLEGWHRKKPRHATIVDLDDFAHLATWLAEHDRRVMREVEAAVLSLAGTDGLDWLRGEWLVDGDPLSCPACGADAGALRRVLRRRRGRPDEPAGIGCADCGWDDTPG